MAGTRDFISGIVWGGLVGVAIGLLVAPRSGEETMALLRERSDEFQHQARETADHARERAVELQQRGRELIDENRERIVRTAEAVKQSAREAAQTPSSTSSPAPTSSEL